MFSTVYRLTQKYFYARPFTSMWAPVVARQISKRYSSSCQVFISMWGVTSSTASLIRCLKSDRYLSKFSPVHNVLKDVVYSISMYFCIPLAQIPSIWYMKRVPLEWFPLTSTYSIISYGNTMFASCLLSQEHNYGVNHLSTFNPSRTIY